MSYVVDTLRALASACGLSVARPANSDSWAGADEDVCVLSYKSDFAQLWGVAKGGVGLTSVVDALNQRPKDRNLTLLLCCDGLPHSTNEVIETAQYVAPQDWAMGLSLALVSAKVDVRLRILLLDLEPDRGSSAFGRHALFAWHNLFPWIQEYRLVLPAGDGLLVECAITDDDPDEYAWARQAIPPERSDIDRLIRDLRQPRCVLSLSEAQPDHSRVVGLVRDTWRQRLLAAGTRHSIANLTAPLILAQALPGDVRAAAIELLQESSPSRQAVTSLLDVLGLLALKESPREGRPPVLTDNGGAFGRRTGIRFCLVDDQYALGFHHVLSFSLFGGAYDPTKARSVRKGEWTFDAAKTGAVRCMSSAAQILETLEQSGPVKDWSGLRCLQLPDCDVLVLDLRLWGTGPVEDARRTFFVDLTRICDMLGCNKILDNHFRQALAAAKTIAKGEQTDELPALALLPLLLSHYDPSLPIVLFSSTHQREVTEMLGHRPNIVRDFAKPLLSGYGDSRAHERIGEDLERALWHAINLHEARVLWQRLQHVSWKWSPPFFAKPGGAREVVYYNVDATGPRHKPQINGVALRARLGNVYVAYVIGRRFFDFASIPSEIFEASLTPLTSLGFGNTGFGLLTKNAAPSDALRRNLTAESLIFIRNRKAHGFEITSIDSISTFQVVITKFMVLLDFLCGEEFEAPGLSLRLNIACDALWEKMKNMNIPEHLRRKKSPPGTYLLTNSSDIPFWLFCLYAIVRAARDGSIGDKVYLSEQTCAAVLGLCASWTT